LKAQTSAACKELDTLFCHLSAVLFCLDGKIVLRINPYYSKWQEYLPKTVVEI